MTETVKWEFTPATEEDYEEEREGRNPEICPHGYGNNGVYCPYCSPITKEIKEKAKKCSHKKSKKNV